MNINSKEIIIPKAYQRRLHPPRVARIVANFDEHIANEPKISYRDGNFYAFDGQHSIASRKMMNNGEDLPIRCKVYRGLTESDEALLFAQQTGESAPLTASAEMRALIFAGDKNATAFLHATEAAGFHLGFEQGCGSKRIICINTAFSEFKRVGAELYKEALDVLQAAWTTATIRNILENERFCGDVILQKTYVTDPISKKIKKNNGELPKVFIKNNHPAIIERSEFERVQLERARRGAKRRVSDKAATELGKYSSIYALTDKLICGECGTPYKRIVWTTKGVKKVVWRCTSRYDHGTKYCKQSPTLDEESLHGGKQRNANQ